MNEATVYLIPSLLSEEAIETIPAYLLDAVRKCNVLFVENERTARRFVKKLSKDIVIDNYEWLVIAKHDQEEAPMLDAFSKKLKERKNIGIISEAGCPGIADPGQKLVAIAHQHNVTVKPLVGPSSILLALMASGLNGQQFQFVGYLPIDHAARIKALKELETESKRKNCTQVFIETPYRNNQLLETILKTVSPSTLLCVAANLTAPQESVHTKKISEWKKGVPDLHKQPVIFCLFAGPLS
jgi:16S rRNA (cytidine1402-2'-O)-methyltransferase